MSQLILIVDDDPTQRRILETVANRQGYRTRTAAGGREALDILRDPKQEPVELILLDLNMPVMDGEQFTRQLRTRPDLNDVAVVIVSTEANRERLERMRVLGVQHTLRKPFEPEDLCRLIAEVLGAKSA